MKKIIKSTALILCVLCISGCAPTSKQMVNLTGSSLEERQMQVRTFDTLDESKILSSSVATLQDMGFNIDEINRDFGVVTCSKTRDAREAGQQIGYFLLSLLSGVNAMGAADHTQTIRATVVTTPKDNIKKETAVRLTVMRVMYNSQCQVTRIETIKEEEIYKQFFDKVSKSVFLEEQNV